MSFGEEFLTYPDLFPARHGGEPWGDRNIVLDLPGGPYRFTGLNDTQEQGVRARFGPLCRPPGATAEAPVETTLFRVAPSEFRPIDMHGWVYRLDYDFASTRVRLAGLRLLGSLSWEPGLTGALWTSDQDPAEFPWLIFENFFRVLVAYRLLDCGGALLHSAAVVDGGTAHLFLGHSGAGKTTLSRISLATGRTVLSDDLNALVPGAGAPAVAKLPFTGELGGLPGPGGRFPAQAIYRLVKGSRSTLQPLTPAAALALLIACSPTVNQDPHRFPRLGDNLTELLRAVAAYELRFTLDEDPWPLLRSLQAEAKRC